MTDLDLLALHGLAVKKAGGPDAVAAILGAEEAGVAAALEAAVEAGRAAGAKGTFMVAPAGREWLDERYPRGLRRVPRRPRPRPRPTSASSGSTASCWRSSPTGR